MNEEVEDDNFDIDWLNERYPFDAEARAKGLETKVLNSLEDKEKVTLVDVGAGTGSNCLYFVEQIPQNQKWYLVEQNADLRNATIKRFRGYANYHKYSFERKKDKLSIGSKHKKIEVHLLNDSLLKLDTLVNLKKVDLVLANAVFDLFSAAQISQFVDLITTNKLSFFTTLTYQGMVFSPDDPFDDLFVNTYHAHMERIQAFGKALGKNANEYMVDAFNKNGLKVATAPSTWQVGRDDIKMHYYLLNFMENALEEMNMKEEMQANFQKWLQRKKDLIITRQQRLEVEHLDIFVKAK